MDQNYVFFCHFLIFVIRLQDKWSSSADASKLTSINASLLCSSLGDRRQWSSLDRPYIRCHKKKQKQFMKSLERTWQMNTNDDNCAFNNQYHFFCYPLYKKGALNGPSSPESWQFPYGSGGGLALSGWSTARLHRQMPHGPGKCKPNVDWTFTTLSLSLSPCGIL